MEAILFDLDGTLLDTTEGIVESAQYAARQMGYDSLPMSTMLQFVGPPIQNSFIKFYNCSEKDAQRAANIFRDYYKTKALFKAKVYDGIHELMEEIRKRNLKVAVATYKREDYALTILEYFGLSKYCDIIHGADNYNKLTKADIINMCINELNVDRKDVVLIGDTEHDAIGAEKAGVSFIGVTYGFGKTNFLKNYSNIGIVQEPKDVLMLL